MGTLVADGAIATRKAAPAGTVEIEEEQAFFLVILADAVPETLLSERTMTKIIL